MDYWDDAANAVPDNRSFSGRHCYRRPDVEDSPRSSVIFRQAAIQEYLPNLCRMVSAANDGFAADT